MIDTCTLGQTLCKNIYVSLIIMWEALRNSLIISTTESNHKMKFAQFASVIVLSSGIDKEEPLSKHKRKSR